MKHLFTLCLCLASAFTMNAQSVSLFNVDASGFPTVNAINYSLGEEEVLPKPINTQAETTLRLTHPNGGEVFGVGSDTTITWDGIKATDTVTLHFSMDDGKIWNLLTTNATGLSYKWNDIPKPISSQCRILVSQNPPADNDSDVVINFIGHTAAIRCAIFSPDGATILTTSEDRTMKLWDTNGKCILTIYGDINGYNQNAVFDPTGTKIAAGSPGRLTIGDQFTPTLWDVKTATIERVFNYHTGSVYSVAFSPDGKTLASGSVDRTVKLWNIADGSNILTLTGFKEYIRGVTFSPDGKTLATSSGTLQLWDVATGENLRTFIGHRNLVWDAVFSPDGTKILSGSHDGTAKLWDVATGALLLTFRHSIYGHGVYRVAFSPDGNQILAAMDSAAIVWDAKNGMLIRKYNYYKNVSTVNFSPDGTKVLVGSWDGTAKLWLKGKRALQSDTSDAPFTIKIDTALTTIIVQDITAKAGEKVNLTLKLLKSSGMQIVGAPTDWSARIHYNKSILFNEQTSNVCPGTTDSCVLELTGVYNPKMDELISISCIATLGNTDHSPIVIDTFYWKNSAIATDVVTQNGTITISGTCEDGGVRLFIPAKSSTSLATRPNPVQDKLQIQYGLREPLTVTLELLTMTGQVVQTIMNNQTQVAGQYTLTSDLSLLGNGVYLLRLRTNKEILTTRVDVVK